MSGRAQPTVLVGLAGAAAAVHVIDDNVIEPGWEAARSQLPSTIVPLVAVGLLVWLTTRPRAGTRAVATLALGAVCATFGSEALHHAATERLAGDDWTGLVSLLVGVVVIGSSLVELWRSRRSDGTRLQRYARRSLKAALALIIVVNVAYPIVDAYIGVNVARRSVPEPDLGVVPEEVTFDTVDGQELAGWYVPSENGSAVLVFPGLGAPQHHARMLLDHGYGVLLVDPRGLGDSDGVHSSWGWGSEEDVHAAIAFLQRRPDVEPGRIGALGLSVGGEVLLQAAAENPGLQAVVSEGAGARSWYEYRHQDGSERWLWAGATINRMLATSVFASRMPPLDLFDLVPRIEQPVLFIYASQGVGGEDLTEQYYDLASGPKELWQTDSGHTGGLSSDPEDYERRVVGFLDEALLDPAVDPTGR